ncbi:hypothetical protein SDC9_164484 [bioreactor metagenome]|uniref:Uncharacterized protein n=1 Tax=bioreactor metagenome TaxID=1076179 RepID=A0A645FZ36_9ZZZZ
MLRARTAGSPRWSCIPMTCRQAACPSWLNCVPPSPRSRRPAGRCWPVASATRNPSTIWRRLRTNCIWRRTASCCCRVWRVMAVTSVARSMRLESRCMCSGLASTSPSPNPSPAATCPTRTARPPGTCSMRSGGISALTSRLRASSRQMRLTVMWSVIAMPLPRQVAMRRRRRNRLAWWIDFRPAMSGVPT